MSAPTFRGLVLSDVDSTFITQEVIELVADHVGVRDEVEAITTAAMRGELDFADSLARRVALLKGLPEEVLDEVRAAVTLRDGAVDLVREALARGWRFVLVSGGFEEIVGPIARELGIHQVVANRFEIENGRLTGRTRGEVVTAGVKARTARENQAEWGIPRARTLAIGDGANDTAMMREAAFTVGIAPKPALAEVVGHVFDGSLGPVRDLLREADGSALA